MNEENKHWGSTLNDFLYEEGNYEEAKAQATARVISWQLAQEMKKRHHGSADGRADAN